LQKVLSGGIEENFLAQKTHALGLNQEAWQGGHTGQINLIGRVGWKDF
jgi:hypothetical protein